jgi:rhamnogalacturonyl hydrolase YesR
MPLTRSELVCLTTGIAVGALAGANSEKIKTALSGLLGLVTEGMGQGYAAAAQKVAEHVEGLQDAVAEAKSGGEAVKAAVAPAAS